MMTYGQVVRVVGYVHIRVEEMMVTFEHDSLVKKDDSLSNPRYRPYPWRAEAR